MSVKLADQIPADQKKVEFYTRATEFYSSWYFSYKSSSPLNPQNERLKKWSANFP